MLKGPDKKNRFVETSSYPNLTMFDFNLTWCHYSQKIYKQFTYGTLCLKIDVLTFKIDV